MGEHLIDKDFVEWRVLESQFPNARVLLCQFHTLAFWRKLLIKRKYGLKVADRDAVEQLFVKMVYW